MTGRWLTLLDDVRTIDTPGVQALKATSSWTSGDRLVNQTRWLLTRVWKMSASDHRRRVQAACMVPRKPA